MPIENLPGTCLISDLISLDQEGGDREKPDRPKQSKQIFRKSTLEYITDVLIISHGWSGNTFTAHNKFQAWTGVLVKQRTAFQTLKASATWLSFFKDGKVLVEPSLAPAKL